MNQSNQLAEYVYVMRDRLDNNRIKVGYSKDPVQRLKQLYNTSSALPMTFSCIWRVSDMRLAEKAAHEVLKPHRINPDREFFEIAPLPHSDEFERTDYSITSDYLYTLLQLIEDGWEYLGISYSRINSLDEII